MHFVPRPKSVKSRSKKAKLAAIALVGGLLLLIVIAAGLAILHTQAFQNWAVAEIISSVQKNLGARAEIQAFRLRLFPVSADLYGFVLRGKESMQGTPLFEAEHIHVALRFWPLLHKQAQMDRILIERPQVFVQVDSAGQTNLPTPPAAQTSSGFHVAVHYAQVRDGTLLYNNRQIPLSADLYGLQASVALSVLTNQYQARLQYDRGQILARNVKPLQHGLLLRASLDATQCKLEQLKIMFPKSQIEGQGVLTNYDHPHFVGTYRASVVGGEVGFLLSAPDTPAGELALEGNLNYASPTPSATFFDDAYADGTFHSRVLMASADGRVIPVRELRGHYVLQSGRLELSDVQASVLGGALRSASDTIDLRSGAGSLKAELRGVSLQEASGVWQSAQRVRQPLPRLASRAILQLAINWKRQITDSVINLQGQFSSQGIARTMNDIPLDGMVDISYDVPAERAIIRRSSLKTGATQLAASGTLANKSLLNVDFSTTDLHELAVLAAENGGADFIARAKLNQLRGAAAFRGEVSGTVRQPHVQGALAGTNIVFDNSQWQTVQANVALAPNSVQLTNGVVQGSNGRIQFAARVPLRNWSPDSSAPFSADLTTQKLSLAAMQQLGGTRYPVQGLLNSEVHLHGSLSQPQGYGHLDLINVNVYGQTLTAVNVQFKADADEVHAEGKVQSPAGTVTANTTYHPQSEQYQLTAELQNLNASKLTIQKVNLPSISGLISGQVSGSGTLRDPQLKATLESAALEIRGETSTSVHAELTLSNHRGNFQLSSVIEGTQITGRGSVALTGNYDATLAVDTGSINMGPILKTYVPAASLVDGNLEVHATANGPLKQPEEMQVHLQVPVLQVSGKGVTLANPRPIRIDYTHGVVNILDASLKGSGTDFSVSGSVPLQNTGAMNLSAKGNLDLKVIEGLMPDALASGQVQLQAQLRGTRANPDMSGAVQIANVALSSDALPLGIESLNGSATLSGKRLHIEKLSGEAGGGTLNIAGTVDLGANPVYALTLTARSARVRQNGVRAILDTDLTFNNTGAGQLLGGRVLVRRLSFEQGSDLSGIIAQLSGDKAVSAPSAFEQRIKLNVSVQSEEEVNLASSQVSVAGAANLQVIGNMAQPVVLGRVSLTGGEVFFLGKRFELQSGTIVFANTAATNPILNLDVSTVVEQYNLTIHLSGPLDRLKTTYTSDPALATADIINLLAFGQTTAEAQSRSTAPGSIGAESSIASAVGGQLAGQLQKVAGISQLTVNPLAGSTQNPGAQVAIQQRVTGNLLVTFGTDITSAQTQTVQILYQVNRNVSVSVLRDENGGYGLDIRFHKVF
jgi:translocation and assembly module TamB